MQRKKNIRRFILLVILTITCLMVGWWVQPENRLDVPRDLFRVQDFRAIDRVTLEADTSAVTLSFNGTRWRVNDRYDADGDMINVLFATLQQAIPKRPVGKAMNDSLFNRLETEGVVVSLFEGERLALQFMAGGNGQKTQAFYADPRAGNVYAMVIPGYRVYVSGIFEMPESGWRDKLVFGFNWRNFKSLEASFPAQPAESFTVAMEKDFFGIVGLPEADTARLNTFLDQVSLLTVDEYLPDQQLAGSLQQQLPAIDITVSDVGKGSYRLRLYKSGDQKGVFGLIQDHQPALFSRNKVQPLLRPRSFFRKK